MGAKNKTSLFEPIPNSPNHFISSFFHDADKVYFYSLYYNYVLLFKFL